MTYQIREENAVVVAGEKDIQVPHQAGKKWSWANKHFLSDSVIDD